MNDATHDLNAAIDEKRLSWLNAPSSDPYASPRQMYQSEP
jgi:hypothetical protein